MKTGIYVTIKTKDGYLNEYDFDEGLAITLQTHTNEHTAFEETVGYLREHIRDDLMHWYITEYSE